MSCVFHVYAMIYVCTYEYDKRLGRAFDEFSVYVDRYVETTLVEVDM